MGLRGAAWLTLAALAAPMAGLAAAQACGVASASHSSASAIVSADTWKIGNSVPAALRKAAASGQVSSSPAMPPMAAISRLSPSSSRTTKPGGKPSALSVAYSARRSRAVIVMVLAITAMMMTTMM